ncbi:hypothetical protein ACFLU5_04285 [Bacteroidota bacterium]
MFPEPLQYFKKNIRDNAEKLKILKKQTTWLAVSRILIFLTALATLIYFISTEIQSGIWLTILISFPIYIYLYINHQKTNRKIQYHETLISINKTEIKKLNGDFHDLDQGTEFMVEDHPYLKDLDIFGSNSAFQHLNGASTENGRKLLADWLKYRSIKDEVHKRQEAVIELCNDPDWFQKFRAKGMLDKETENNDEDIVKFLSGFQDTTITRKHIILWISLLVVMITGTILVGINIIGVKVWITLLILNLLFLASIRSRIKTAYQSTRGAASVFKTHFNRIVLIENHDVNSEKLNEIRNLLFSGITPASIALKRLNRILSSLENMGNQMYQIMNIFMILDMAILFNVDKWTRMYSVHLENWLMAIYETEALISLAGYTFAHPDYSFPQISEDNFTLQGTELGHPLIHPDKRICNDFSFSGSGNVAIITGSNMAGKSTFLRTIGLNMVLGLSGAPVCATSMTIPDILVFTSMRTEDNLEKNISSFYAELERIRQLLDHTSQETVLFLLDEILKGTNSQDRHAGAISLIRQLKQTNSFGLVSTHDVDLARQMRNDKLIANYSFDSQIDGEQILFDFKLKEGICQNFNASQLMKKMGIKVDG